MTAKEIRDSFKKFFESKGHAIVPSAPMVIKDDPTLMFTNAGMNQWKDIILGTRDPEPRRRADTQKCLRVSGKHNDLEEVGHDTYHHTMFEMLGNWSFGDYFKEGAIDMAWEYLVDVLKLNPDDLYVTVFEGSPEENIPRDDEAARYWSKHVPADHIINGNKHDNFWEMGDTGPCGPCSEIHVDSRTPEQRAASGKTGRELVNQDDPQVIEIWNLVFMQFNRKADGSLEKLSMNVIDTGMGFERLVRMMQGKHSNYDTDVFQPIIKAEQAITGLKYTTFEEEVSLSIESSESSASSASSASRDSRDSRQEQINVAMRVCADHLRAVAFSIADGQLPSNAKAGYVIRRILRRAVRYAYTFLGQKEAFLYKLLPTLVEEMGDAFPELKAQQTLIGKVMKEEEDAFLRTLDKGISLLEKAMAEVKASVPEGSPSGYVLDGVQAFRLFDTYGFPLDLTELICRENGFTVNEEQFNVEMQKQKERARNAAAVENSDWVVVSGGSPAAESSDQAGASGGSPAGIQQQFVGYDYTEYTCRILRYRKVTQKKNEFYELVLDNTPFYGEMGGQVGDQGVLVSENETVEIIDSKRENNQTVHIVKKLPQDPTAQFMACVDTDKRDASAANHTATHLLDYALKQVLGDHVEQKGSFVSPDTLRFDFSHFQKVSDEELRQVERIVNDMVRQDLPLDEHRDTPFEEAKKMGAIALFGEKYGDKVRVVRFGPSCEFCGGIHAKSTGRIGMFKIISESSVAAGIRRIEAKTGKECEELFYQVEDTVKAIKNFFNNAKDLEGVIRKYIEEHDTMKKEIEAFQAQAVERAAKQLVENARIVNGVTVVSSMLPMEPAAAKDLVFKVKSNVKGSLLCVIGTVHQDKPLLSVMMSEDMVKEHGLNAGQMVREAAKLIQGGGGGQPHYASAGGKNADGLSAAIDKVIGLANL